MPTTWQILHGLLVVAAGIAMVFVVRWRRKSYAAFLRRYADEAVCEHLRPAYELLLARGHVVARAGQRRPDLPVEIHMAPEFDPAEVMRQCSLREPVSVSDRNVVYCAEDWVELHPAEP